MISQERADEIEAKGSEATDEELEELARFNRLASWEGRHDTMADGEPD